MPPRGRARSKQNLFCLYLDLSKKLLTPPRRTQTPRHRKMLLTACAACAAPLAHNAPRCVRCHTRYCNATCQHDHWRRGHKQMCKKIHRGGNAEQYNADKKYKEAVAVAVEKCAADTMRRGYITFAGGYSQGAEIFWSGQ